MFQLLRKHRPNVLLEVLLTLHDKKSLSVETLLTLLGVNCKHDVVASLLRRHSLVLSRNLLPLCGGGRLRDEPKECLHRRQCCCLFSVFIVYVTYEFGK